jgi:O-antigen ligase
MEPFLNKSYPKLFFCTGFFTSYLGFFLGQNPVSFFVIAFFLLGIKSSGKFAIKDFFSILAFFFACICILNPFFIPNHFDDSFLVNSIKVIPNYLYWCVILIFFSQNYKLINWKSLIYGISVGLIFSTLHRFFIDSSFENFFIRGIPQNNLAFILIIFSPILIFHIYDRYGFKIALLIFVSIGIVGFLSGSRAGSILVIILSGSQLLISHKYSGGKLLRILVLISFILYLTIQTSTFKNVIYALNPRTYSLIYETEETKISDQSYLIRKAMVEKGLEIFSKYPMWGIGLGNFVNFDDFSIPGNFLGSEIILAKESLIMRKNAHNSYILILAEMGLTGFTLFISLNLYCLIYIYIYRKRIFTFQWSFILGYIGMLLHYYVISAVVNVYPWILLGLVASILHSKKHESPKIN